MNIIIVGCGKIGASVLASLVAEGHNVTAVDNDPAVIEEITNIYDVIGVCGNCTDPDVLEEAGVEAAQMFAAFTSTDELNMLSCFMAKKMGAAHTIARIRNPEYNDRYLGFMKNHLGISMVINPEKRAARELFNILRLPSAVKVDTFSDKRFEMVELKLKPDSALDGMSLAALRKKYPIPLLICVVRRGDKVYIPDGNFVLKGGDKIALTASPTEVHKFLRASGILQKQARNVMILGAGRISYYLAQMLTAHGNSVKIVERREERCRDFSERLPEVSMVCGDGASQELMLEEGIRHMDAFVSLTGMDEENMLISYFAMTQKVPKVITKINRDEFSAMAESLGLDSTISPRKTVADIIVRYARALENSLDSSVETLYKIMDSKAEALEFIAGNDCAAVNIPLKAIQLKPNILIAGIIRGKKIILPSGDDMIQPGDKVVIIAAGHRINNLSDILK